jgi:hypothetical protein
LRISYSAVTPPLCQIRSYYRLKYDARIDTRREMTLPTFVNFGRRRGRCLHETMKAKTGRLLSRTYGRELVKRVEVNGSEVHDLDGDGLD